MRGIHGSGSEKWESTEPVSSVGLPNYQLLVLNVVIRDSNVASLERLGSSSFLSIETEQEMRKLQFGDSPHESRLRPDPPERHNEETLHIGRDHKPAPRRRTMKAHKVSGQEVVM